MLLHHQKQTAKLALYRLGLSSVLCLDAGDRASYDGVSQQWNDVSGNGNHFVLGSTTGSDTTDPTFNGTPGAATENEYFTTDGGDFFTPAGTQTFDDAWHQNGAVFTCVMIYFSPTNNTNRSVMGNAASTTAEGLRVFTINTGGGVSFQSQNGTAAQSFTSGWSVGTGVWNFMGLSINENGGASGGNWLINSNVLAFDPNYTSPSAGSPANSWQIYGRGGTGTAGAPAAGDRIPIVVMSAAAWTPTQMLRFRNIMRTRFPGL